MALADMPDLRGDVHTLCEALFGRPDRITVPVFGGKRGNSWYFSRLRAELEALDRDWGEARELIPAEESDPARPGAGLTRGCCAISIPVKGSQMEMMRLDNYCRPWYDTFKPKKGP